MSEPMRDRMVQKFQPIRNDYQPLIKLQNDILSRHAGQKESKTGLIYRVATPLRKETM